MLQEVGEAGSTVRIGQMPNSNVQGGRCLVGGGVANEQNGESVGQDDVAVGPIVLRGLLNSGAHGAMVGN